MFILSHKLPPYLAAVHALLWKASKAREVGHGLTSWLTEVAFVRDSSFHIKGDRRSVATATTDACHLLEQDVIS